MFPRRPDILEQHADLTERVRKLEVMNVSRVLKPRAWEPDKDHADAIVGHAVLACGVHGLGGQGPWIPPAAHYLFRAGIDNYVTGGFNPQVAVEFYTFCQHLGIGPKVDLATMKAVRVLPGPDDPPEEVGEDRWELTQTTGGELEDEKRTWYFTGLPVPIMLFPDEWHPMGAGQQYGWNTTPEGGTAATLPAYGVSEGFVFAEFLPQTPVEDYSHFHIQPAWYVGWWEEGDPLIERATFYFDGSENQDCGEPPVPEPMPEGGYPYVTFRSDQGMPCQNSIFSGRTGGVLTYATVINPVPDVSAIAHPTVEPMRGASVYRSGYPGWEKLLERVAILFGPDWSWKFPNLIAWYDSMIPHAAAVFNSKAHEGWHQMDLNQNWFGTAEIMVTGAEVRFRGEVFNFAARPSWSRFAKVPDYIPFPPWNTIRGTTMRAFLTDPPEHDGKVVLVRGSGGGGSDHPDEQGSYLETYAPQLGIAPPNGYVRSSDADEPWRIRLDGMKWSTDL